LGAQLLFFLAELGDGGRDAIRDLFEGALGSKADYMEVYQLDSEHSAREDITDKVITEVMKDIKDVAENIRKNNLPRKCEKENCAKCHLNYLCLSRTEKKQFAI
jgi:hypothetical protein